LNNRKAVVLAAVIAVLGDSFYPISNNGVVEILGQNDVIIIISKSGKLSFYVIPS
jgi:D-arabinose 5-phosphate isomerase GutQ